MEVKRRTLLHLEERTPHRESAKRVVRRAAADRVLAHPPVYIRPPKCARRSFDEIWQSFVAIYGMEIAGRLFYLRVKNALVALGMIESTIFQATYRYSGKTCVARLSKFTLEDVQIFIATHVDDFIFVSTNDEFRLKLMKELSMTFTFGTDDQISTLLGLEITRNRKERTMEISCGAKIREMLKRYGLDHSNSDPIEVALVILPLGSTIFLVAFLNCLSKVAISLSSFDKSVIFSLSLLISTSNL